MQPIPFSEFRRLYLHILSGPRYSPATMKKMRQVLRHAAALGVERTDQLTTAIAAEYARTRIKSVCANFGACDARHPRPHPDLDP